MEGDFDRGVTSATVSHFNPLPPHGGRPCRPGCSTERADFNPLPPHGGRRYAMVSGADSSSFQSTPSAWRETVLPPGHKQRELISIHSLRMEGDTLDLSGDSLSEDFNPLPPHGGRLISCPDTASSCGFQSTPSAWRETES